ncbi:MAG: phosphomannomutase/phosphoglucomutase [Armatimonadota bacterium]
MTVFKACDIRGVYPDELDEGFAHDLGRAVGTLMDEGAAVVGGDVRRSTPGLQAAVIEGLMEAGREVIDLGTVPTPVFYFALPHLSAAGGVMVTASHNPGRYNGFKLMLSHLPITTQEVEKVRQVMEEGSFASGQGCTNSADVLPDYLGALRELAPRADGLKLVADLAGGCAALTAPQLLAEMGADLSLLHAEVDPTLTVRDPNPVVAGGLADLREAVPAAGADLGVAFDGDGDRVAFVDDRGEIVPGDAASVLLIRHLLAQQAGAHVVHDIKCSAVVPEAVQERGGVPIMERSGYAFIKRRMIEADALFGCEMSGHYFYWSLNGGDDGLYTALIMCDVLRRAGRPLSALAASVPRYTTTPDLRIPYDVGRIPELMQEVRAHLTHAEVCDLDGVRADYGDGWALLRPSVTEPIVTLRFEAHSDGRLREIVSDFLTPAPDLREQVLERL